LPPPIPHPHLWADGVPRPLTLSVESSTTILKSRLYSPIPPSTEKDICIRDKYLQNHSCIIPVISDMRAPIMDALAKKYTDVKVELDSSCFLHVRRGDYVNIPGATLPAELTHTVVGQVTV
jgi:hypothetical protein